ncbi:Rha family transcriptional regulator [Tetzosporium hominis]|uniref:Rha family transcriptional regulator n=1 Tax=Tetzosporium hominis TaxID=2020506 RepID=A0A264W7B3_9BACL|nr:phage antirepressor KilAC domain-containing protein [Tetzosporium hominis]OZS79476.1 Rha family transcriptional regulator [Tetzosporium hominis]
MNELKVVSVEGQLVTDSRDVAEMVGKSHDQLMRSIRTYVDYLDSAKLQTQNFFIPSTYTSAQNKEMPCYLLTKKGCDMVANKMTGEKGVLFTAAYVTKFEEMEKQLAHRLPTSYKEALVALLEEVEKRERIETKNLVLEQQVMELKPKATYYDLILQNKSLLTATQIGKDYGMGAPKFNQLLHKFGIQYKQGGVWLLYAKYQDRGYTQTSTYALDEEYSKINTKWTQKGRLFLYDFLKSQGIVPMIEREESA